MGVQQFASVMLLVQNLGSIRGVGGGDPEGEERHRREAAPPGWEGQVIEAGDSLPRLVRGAEGRVDLPLHGHEPDKCVQRT